MQYVSAVDVRVLLLAPPDDGALPRAVRLRDGLALGRQAGQVGVLEGRVLGGDLEQGDVVVDGVGVVGLVEDGVLHEVLALGALRKDKMMS